MDLEELRRKRRRLYSTGAPDEHGVIDLTEDTPEPEESAEMTDDEAYARRLQAELDGEGGVSVSRSVAGSSSDHVGRSDAELADERVARELQAQFDVEQPTTDSRSRTLSLDGSSTTPSKDQVISSAPSISARKVENTLRTLYSSIKGYKCQQCAKGLFKHEKDVLSLYTFLMEQSTFVGRGVVCPDCQMVNRTDNDQLVLTWILLCGFDQSSRHNKADKKKRSSTTKPNASKGTGVGYGGYGRPTHGWDVHEAGDFGDDDDHMWVDGMLNPALTGGGAHMPATFSQEALPPGLLEYHFAPGHPIPGKPVAGKSPAASRSKAAKKADTQEDKNSKDDKMTAAVLRFLTPLLPSLDKESELDVDPPAEQLRCLLLGSSILERVADLFRNNNLEEVTNHAELYDAVVSFARTLAQHPATSVLAFEERVARSPGVSILKVSSGKTDLVSTEQPDTTQSLARCIRELAGQCKTMMKSSEVSQDHMKILHPIGELNDFLAANAGAEMKTTNHDEWQKDLAVSEVVDEAIMPKHKLQCLAQRDPQVLQSQPGRMARIMQEIARLQSSLPDGIFVRYAATRPDVMKVLIIGPKDTPYENGLFEFDMLCGPKFPQEPPKMDFRTTGGGSVHFNPNLYPEGKVCLSILGTWPGESWNPKKSSLLQILVSIQAMIFCDSPYNNEPGRENFSNSDENSKAYNRGLYFHTVQTAMLDWLDRRRFTPSAPPSRRGHHLGLAPAQPPPMYRTYSPSPAGQVDDTEDIWDEVVKRHFESKKDQIIETVTKWIADKAPPPQQARRFPQPPSGVHPPPSLFGMMPGTFSGAFPGPGALPLWQAASLTNNHQGTALNGPTFSGTGWQGRTLGGETAEAETDTGKNDAPAGPLEGDNLAAKLRGAVAILKKNAGRYGAHLF